MAEKLSKYQKYTKPWRKANPEKYLEHRKKWRARHPKKYKAQRQRWREKNKSNPNEQLKAKARRRANYIISFLQEDEPIPICAICQHNKADERHHYDYHQPLMIVPVCSQCHRKIHNNISQKDNNGGRGTKEWK
jgi:hypothetical protein